MLGDSMETMYKVKPILNVQNVFLTNSLNVYTIKETEKYIIGCEPKRYTFNYLQYKIDKTLLSNVKFNKENEIRIGKTIDVNVIKKLRENSDKWELNVKNVIMELIPTRYSNLSQLYGIVYQFSWRKTSAGGHDKLEFSIPECPVIANSANIANICYKLVSKQISSSGSHQLHTYLILAPSRGQYVIGQHVWISNINNGGHRNMHIYPVVITL
jgi:hypothetical protein